MSSGFSPFFLHGFLLRGMRQDRALRTISAVRTRWPAWISDGSILLRYTYLFSSDACMDQPECVSAAAYTLYGSNSPVDVSEEDTVDNM